MFTTVTPAAHELSMARRAAKPPNDDPYPTLVGTAITGRSVTPPTTLASAPSIPATTTIAEARRSAGTCLRIRWTPATPASYPRPTGTPMNSSVTAASSATGRSEVPALTTSTRPPIRRAGEAPRRRDTIARARDPFRRRPALSTTTVRAASFQVAVSPNSSRRASACAVLARVASRRPLFATMARAIATHCRVVFPSQRMTSGRVWRIPRWWSTFAASIDSKGRWAIASSASRVLTLPRRTPVSTLRSRAGSMGVHTIAAPGGLLRDRRPLRGVLERLEITQEERLHVGRGCAVIHLAADGGIIVEAAHVPGDVLPHQDRRVIPFLRSQVV